MPRNKSKSSKKSSRGLSIPNPISSARELYSIVREMSFDELHDAAERPPRIAVVGPSVSEARRSALQIFGPAARSNIVTLAESEPWPTGAEVVLLDQRVGEPRGRVDEHVVRFGIDDVPERVLRETFKAGDEIELRIGRAFPEVRQTAALYVVHATARANGQFALVSSIPELIPIVGGVLAMGADTIVLTKNQLMMLYKLAAIHGRDIDNRWRIYSEMLPVVGAAMLWRALAENLIDLIPFGAGVVPKIAVAFGGTYAVGRTAHAYYAEGQKASRGRMREFYREALTLLRERPVDLPERARSLWPRGHDHDRHVIEAAYQFEDDSPERP